MLIDLRSHQKIYHSLYSDVFVAEGKVYKVFKRSIDPNLDSRARTIFEAQYDAYLRASSHAILRKHTPEFFGVIDIDNLIDADGQPIGEGYHVSACYCIEKLVGPEQKVGSDLIVQGYPYVFEMRRQFGNNGIDTADSSVFCYDDPEKFKLIDFRTANF